jgi:hypothetical protein
VSTKSDDLEKAISKIAKIGDFLPNSIPTWMENIGIKPASLITKSDRIGSKSAKNKTDVLIEFEGCPALKISAKLNNGEYYGNWYSHERIMKEFDRVLFDKLTNKTTEWANEWTKNNRSKLFVGVSVSFGKRTGNTFIDFLDIFENTEDLKKIICGVGDEQNAANCLYISDNTPTSIENLIEKLSPVNLLKLEELAKDIKVIFRPVNPLREGSNRDKNVYTKFFPDRTLTQITDIKTIGELSKLGKFTEVFPNGLTHNNVLDTLQANFNIRIPLRIDPQPNWKFYSESKT